LTKHDHIGIIRTWTIRDQCGLFLTRNASTPEDNRTLPLPSSSDSGIQQDQSQQPDQHLVIFQPSGRRGEVPQGHTVLEAAQQLGVGIENLCGGAQTCGKCRVRIEEGNFEKAGITSSVAHVSPPSERERAYLERHEFGSNERFACEAHIFGDLAVFVPETSRTNKQIVRKSATERAITVNPAIRLYYVTVPEPTLADEGQGDLERITDELRQRFGLENLRVDYALLPTLQQVLREGKWGVTVTVWDGREIIRVQPGFHDKAIGLAVDIGTTTVAAYLCDLESGQVLVTEAAMNPQVAYGEDIMSRISYVTEHEGGLATLNTAIVDMLNQLAEAATTQVELEPADIAEVTLVGNTVMHHLVLNLDPAHLGGAPFPTCFVDPIDIKARDLGLRVNPAANVHVLPVKAAYVGADNMGVVLAEAPHEQDDIMLIIDVGTNGEILLGSRERLLSASSPTGPAFEGAQITFGMRAAEGAIERVHIDPQTLETRFQIIGREGWSDTWTDDSAEPDPPPDGSRRGPRPRQEEPVLARGICGSGIIDAIAEMFRAGILLPSGAFNADLQHERIVTFGGLPAFVIAHTDQTTIERDIVITIADVRAVQLAKGALYSGARLLMEELGVTEVDKIVLAGAFGSYIDRERAMILGLFPDCDPAQVYAVGNAAGDGARIALLNRAKRQEIVRVSRWIEHIQIPMVGEFQDRFIDALNLPHASDSFPHVEAWLRGESELS
jgi:uncharacterized 2Fe-2S/4Fe-4S cluster protein (DUF4445 family)